MITWKQYGIGILFTESVGLLSGWLTRNGIQQYQATVIQPPLSPPSFVFPLVWGILFALMGTSITRIHNAPPSEARSHSLRLFFLQLAFNVIWSLIFFNLQWFGIALLWLFALWGLILSMVRSFCNIDTAAGYLQLPYLLWVTFAAYLNFGVWLLNR